MLTFVYRLAVPWLWYLRPESRYWCGLADSHTTTGPGNFRMKRAAGLRRTCGRGLALEYLCSPVSSNQSFEPIVSGALAAA